MNKWYDTMNSSSDIFISSRIRLARNMQNYKFPKKLTVEESNQMIEEVKAVLPFVQQEQPDKKLYCCKLDELSELDKNAMVERHIISPNFAKKKQHTGLIMSEDESLSIMINEEDHLRLQVVCAGKDLENTLKEANMYDDILSQHLSYAYDEKLGFLTSCPTNLGTGMRASYMVFLPALTANGKIQQLLDEVAKYGVTIRGIYGENSKSMGSLYQISNVRTLGVSEAEIIEKLNRLVMQIVQQERKRRDYMLSTNYDEVEDHVYRAYGTLKYARSLSSAEAMSLLADVKFGIDTGLIKVEESVNIFKLMMSVRPSSIQWKLSKPVGKVMRDRIRAEYIRKRLPELQEDQR